MMQRRIIFALLFVSCLWAAPLAYGADLLSQFHPSLTVKEEYSDNLNLTSANKKDDFITTVQPGLKYSNMDNVSGVDLDALLGFVFYGKNSNLNYLSANANLNVKYLSTEHINFYFKDSFTRSDSPREQEYFSQTADNRYVLATQTQRAVYWRNVAAPTVEYQFGPENRVGINYRNNLYQTDSTAGQNSQENYINPFLSYWFDKQNGIALEYGLTYGDFDRNPDLIGHQAKARYTNRFRATSSAFAEYTFSKRTFTSPGVNYDVHEPTVGITHALTPTLNGSVQAGYFWKMPDNGPATNGFSYKAELRNIDPRTTFQIGLQGGYTEDLFTSDNLGFNRYQRLTGSLTHLLDKQISVGGFASLERAEFDQPEHKDTIWGIGCRASYTPLKWLTLALEYSYKNRQSDVSSYEYAENRGMFTITATY